MVMKQIHILLPHIKRRHVFDLFPLLLTLEITVPGKEIYMIWQMPAQFNPLRERMSAYHPPSYDKEQNNFVLVDVIENHIT